MKYLCLCYYDTDAFARLADTEAEAVGAACRPHDAALKETGRLLVLGSLAGPESWRHFTPKQEGPSRASGPYLEGRHQIGAFFVLDAQSEEEALAAASKHAAANYGEHLGFAVEVRPCDIYETYEVHR